MDPTTPDVLNETAALLGAEGVGVFGALASDALAWIHNSVLRVDSLYQAAAIALCALAAFMLTRPVQNLLNRLIPPESPWILRRVALAANALAAPIALVALQWIVSSVFTGVGLANGLLRLSASLLNAWIVIRLATAVLSAGYGSRLVALMIWCIAALSALDWLQPIATFFDGYSVPVGEGRLSLWTALRTVAAAATTIWLSSGLVNLADAQLARARGMNAGLRVLSGKLIRAVVFLAAVLFALNWVGVDLTTFAVLSGAIGVGVGFGLQRSVANLVAGLTLLSDRSLKPGDVIEFVGSNGASTIGIVQRFGGRYVSVVTTEGVETLIPNETLVTNPVSNWSYSDDRVRLSVTVGVAYTADVEAAQAACIAAALATSRVLHDPAPACWLVNFGDSSVDLDLRFWIGDPQNGVSNVLAAVRLGIWRAFKREGVEIPFPQRDIHIRSVPPQGLPPHGLEQDGRA